MIKSLIPNKLKYPFWYVFKAPQRKLTKGTLQRDIKGLGIYLFRKFRKKQPHKISICVGIANRTEQFLDFVLPSLLRLKNKEYVELSLFDMGSADFDVLEKTICEKWKGSLVLGKTDEKFYRAKAFNKAVEQSSGNVIFLCDADMSLPANLVEITQQIIRKDVAWFPIYFANAPDDNPQKGKWLWWSAKGMLACLKSDFERAGKLNEKYRVWGQEDGELWESFHKHKFVVIRQKLRGLIHHYHSPVEGATDYFKEW